MKMAQFPFSTNHSWFRRQVQIDGRSFFHQQCPVCGRDFARPTDDPEWRAVQVGILSFDFLDDETTQRWVSEDCPGHRLPADEDSERIRPGGEVHASAQRGAGTADTGGEPTS